MSNRYSNHPGSHPPITATKARRRSNVKRAVAVGIILGLLVAAAGVYRVLRTPLDHFKGHTQPARPLPSRKTISETHRVNLLLLGTDSRPGEAVGNTDVIVLCSLDNQNKRIEMMSIPRDTKVVFPDGTAAKINEALRRGGPELTVQLVQSLLNQRVDYYALTRFNGLVDMIDTIGGVTVNVKQRMYYNTGDKQYNLINLRPGQQTLDGAQALGFVRFRHDALGDIGRTGRQQEFLAALTSQLLEAHNVRKLPSLIQQLWKTIDTNMNALEVGDIAAHAEQYERYPIIHETLPGSFHNADPNIPRDQSFWIVNPEQAKYVAKQFFASGTVQKNPVQDPNFTQSWVPPVQGPVYHGTSQANGGPANSTPGNSGSPSNGAPSNGGPPSSAPANNGTAGTQADGSPVYNTPGNSSPLPNGSPSDSTGAGWSENTVQVRIR
ncbi:LCP family protein [Alicyclobacillus tolerans]|uniref:LCP family protein n=1 Tax=Alicyclobacillus tolerans TaxID=90970 RepID=UPI001F1CAF48|nr:LCP family protein [Alicyclobacillus tolerans]MCF8563489.1 LCP family protein [Alicyclobacillus tolerans]